MDSETLDFMCRHGVSIVAYRELGVTRIGARCTFRGEDIGYSCKYEPRYEPMRDLFCEAVEFVVEGLSRVIACKVSGTMLATERK
jgi:hypothetical protein